MGGGGGSPGGMGDRRLEEMLAISQMKDSINMYNGIVERCFHGCVSDFSQRTLAPKEEQCMMMCTEKFVKHTKRVGRVFAEKTMGEQQMMEKQMQGGQPQMGGGMGQPPKL